MTNASSIIRPLIRGMVQPITGSQKTTQVFILAGQSNMVGRAVFDGGAGFPKGVYQHTRAGTISGMTMPLDHHDPFAGNMGLDVQFAIEFRAAYPNDELVLLPAAKGGTGFSTGEWRVGDPLYADLVARANALFSANPSFRLSGILWHQGERDPGHVGYEADLDAMIDGLRADIVAANATTPFVLGELLPDFVEAHVDNAAINDIVAATPNRLFYSAVVSSYQPSRLSDIGDGVHFDAISLRELGKRYLAAVSIARTQRPSAPDVVTDLAASGGNQQVALTWTAPASGGMPITDYIVERSLDGMVWAELGDGVSATPGLVDTGLTNGVTYHYRVTPVNSVGAGPVSAAVSAVPEIGAVTIQSTAFAATTDDGVTHSFPGVDLGAGGVVVVVGACRGSADGVSAITVGGQAAVMFGLNTSFGNCLRFGYVTGVPAGPADIVLTHGSSQARAGVHAWVLGNADPAAATVANASGISNAIDATAEGVVLGAAISVNPGSNNIDWTGLDERLEWTDYGDRFGSASADRSFAADANGHSVVITPDGNFKLISLMSVPKS